MRLAAIVALFAALPAGAAAQNKTPRDPVVQVGLFGYRADGMVGGAAYDTWPDLTSTVYVSGARCGMGAGNRKPPEDASDVWQFTGRVLSETSDEAVVQLSWRRMMAGGRATSGDESTMQLTLRRGEAQQLDQASLEPRPGCSTVAVAFEARYAPRLSGPGYPPGMGAGGITSGTPASGGGGVVRGSMQPAGPFGASVAAPQAGGDGGGVRVDGGAQGAERWDVNLWLVRTLPGKPAESTHSVLKMGRDGASFTFAPIRVSTGRGDATVQVSGSLAIVRGSSGEDELVFKTSRRTSTASDGQPTSDRGLDSTGTSRVAFRMPAPGEVLAFEMPPLFIQGELVASDIFSVRLSVAPRR